MSKLPETVETLYEELIVLAAEGFRFDPNSTENQGRWRLIDPKVFDQDKYVTWARWKEFHEPGITFLMGEDKRDGEMKPQAIRFDKATWPEATAKQWWEKNKAKFHKEWTQRDWEHWMKQHPKEIDPDYTGQQITIAEIAKDIDSEEIEKVIEVEEVEIEDESMSDKGTISTFLQSRIHESFTKAADRLYALGFFTTEERIAISSVIGDVLSNFADLLKDKDLDVVNEEIPMEVAQDILKSAILVRRAFSGICDTCHEHSDYLAKHRVKPGWQGGKYVPENIRNLCPKCHKKTHQETGEFEMGGEWRHDILKKELGEEGYVEWQAARGQERQQSLQEMLGDTGYSIYQKFIALKRWHPEQVDMDPEDFLDLMTRTPPGQWDTLLSASEGEAGIKTARLFNEQELLKTYEDSQLKKDLPKTIAVDLDGTILEYDGFKGIGVFGKPIDGVKEVLTQFKDDGWYIIIDTCRGEVPEIIEYLSWLNIPFDAVNKNKYQPSIANSGKPMADYRIDDSAIHFDGSWPAIYEEVKRRERTKGLKIAWKPPIERELDERLLSDELTDEEWLGVLSHIEDSHDYTVGSARRDDIDTYRIVLAGDNYFVYKNFKQIYRGAGKLTSIEQDQILQSVRDTNVISVVATKESVANNVRAYFRHLGFSRPERWLYVNDLEVDGNSKICKLSVLPMEFRVCTNTTGELFSDTELTSFVAKIAQFAYDPEKGILFDFVNPMNDTTQPTDYPDPAYWGYPSKLLKRRKTKTERVKRHSSVLDFPRSTLDQTIWEYIDNKPLPRLRKEVKDVIINQFEDWAASKGINLIPEMWIRDMLFVGSTATTQWSDISDIDIDVIVDVDSIKSIGIVPDDIIDNSIVDWLGIQVSKELNGELIGGHPVNYWLSSDETPIDAIDAIYNLSSDTWIKPPPTIPADFNPEVIFQDVWLVASGIADRFDVLLGEIRRDIADYNDALRHSKEEGNAAWCDAILNRKLTEIQRKVGYIVQDFRELWYAKEATFKNREFEESSYPSLSWSSAVMIWKWLEKYGYLKLLKDVMKIYKDDPIDVIVNNKILALKEVLQ